jgi:hypothetical protein
MTFETSAGDPTLSEATIPDVPRTRPRLDPVLNAFNRPPRPPQPQPLLRPSSDGEKFAAHYVGPRSLPAPQSTPSLDAGVFVSAPLSSETIPSLNRLAEDASRKRAYGGGVPTVIAPPSDSSRDALTVTPRAWGVTRVRPRPSLPYGWVAAAATVMAMGFGGWQLWVWVSPPGRVEHRAPVTSIVTSASMPVPPEPVVSVAAPVVNVPLAASISAAPPPVVSSPPPPPVVAPRAVPTPKPAVRPPPRPAPTRPAYDQPETEF